MAASSAKPSSRKVGAGRASTPVLADPEVVAKVRRLTLKATQIVAEGGSKGARSSWRALVAAARWLGPRASRLAAIVARAGWRGLKATGRFIWTQRKIIGRVGHRVAWWTALAILVLVGRALLAADGDPELIALSALWFGVGLSISVLVLLGAPETRMRVAAFALASGHGTLGALAWMVVGL